MSNATTPWRARSPVRSQAHLHSLVGGNEAESLVETLGIGTGLVGRQLDETATALARPLQRVLDQRPAESSRADLLVYPHPFDRGPPSAFVGHSWRKSDLEDARDLAVEARDDELVVGIGSDRFERGEIALRQRQLVALARRPERIVR